MAYSKEVVARARARLAQAKEDRESENRQHLAEAYVRIPRIREIDMELRRTMAQAAQAVFASGGDPREALDKVKQRNLSLQQERQYLVDAHFEEGYLDESPICDHCGGSGYVGSTMCECLLSCAVRSRRRSLPFWQAARRTSASSGWSIILTGSIPSWGLAPGWLWSGISAPAVPMRQLSL